MNQLIGPQRKRSPSVCPESCDELAGESPVRVVVKQPCSWWPTVGETRALKRHDKAALGGEQATGPQHEANPAASSFAPGFDRGHAGAEPGLGGRRPRKAPRSWNSADGPAGVWGVERLHSSSRNRRDPSRPGNTTWPSGCRPMVPGGGAAYKPTGEGVACRAEVGGGSSSDDGWDNTTWSERRASSQVCSVVEDRVAGLPFGLSTRLVCSENRHVELGSSVNAGGSAECRRSTAWGKAG